MAKSSHKLKTSHHSPSGSGESFMKWMKDDESTWPVRKDPENKRDADSFDREALRVFKEIKHVEEHLQSLKDRHKDLTHHRKRAQEYPYHDHVRHFHDEVKHKLGKNPSMDDLHKLAVKSRNGLMADKIKSFKG